MQTYLPPPLSLLLCFTREARSSPARCAELPEAWEALNLTGPRSFIFSFLIRLPLNWAVGRFLTYSRCVCHLFSPA